MGGTIIAKRKNKTISIPMKPNAIKVKRNSNVIRVKG